MLTADAVLDASAQGPCLPPCSSPGYPGPRQVREYGRQGRRCCHASMQNMWSGEKWGGHLGIFDEERGGPGGWPDEMAGGGMCTSRAGIRVLRSYALVLCQTLKHRCPVGTARTQGKREDDVSASSFLVHRVCPDAPETLIAARTTSVKQGGPSDPAVKTSAGAYNHSSSPSLGSQLIQAGKRTPLVSVQHSRCPDPHHAGSRDIVSMDGVHVLSAPHREDTQHLPVFVSAENPGRDSLLPGISRCMAFGEHAPRRAEHQPPSVCVHTIRKHCSLPLSIYIYFQTSIFRTPSNLEASQWKQTKCIQSVCGPKIASGFLAVRMFFRHPDECPDSGRSRNPACGLTYLAKRVVSINETSGTAGGAPNSRASMRWRHCELTRFMRSVTNGNALWDNSIPAFSLPPMSSLMTCSSNLDRFSVP